MVVVLPVKISVVVLNAYTLKRIMIPSHGIAKELTCFFETREFGVVDMTSSLASLLPKLDTDASELGARRFVDNMDLFALLGGGGAAFFGQVQSEVVLLHANNLGIPATLCVAVRKIVGQFAVLKST